MSIKKPKLPNNYKVNGIEIEQMVLQKDDIEIYKTMQNTYLILFTDFNSELINFKKQKYNIFDFMIGAKKYSAFITKSNYTNKIIELKKDLNTVTGFDAVAGMKDLKRQLLQDVIYPITQKDKYEKFKITIPNGILLYGPPGCGKTFIVRKMAEELNFSYFEIKHSDVTTPYIHGGVGKISEVFAKAKLKAPSIVFIDEIEGLMPERSSIEGSQSYKLEEINEFLMHLNDAGKNEVLVIGATNQLDLIDKAVLRSGRFDKKIQVPPPDFDARIHLFQMYLKGRPLEDIDYEILAGQTINYSCSDIEFICNEAARIAVLNEFENINQETIMTVISKIQSSI